MKRVVSILLILLILVGTVSAENKGLSIASEKTTKVENAYVHDEIIVKFKDDQKPFRVIKVPAGKVKESIGQFQKRADVIYAEPNYIISAYENDITAVTLFEAPNDPQFQEQWNLKGHEVGGINVIEAWQLATGKDIIVAVVDTGVAYRADDNGFAEDLTDTTFMAGYDFINDDDDPMDDNGHGTHVAGTIAQSTNNGRGVAGVAFDSVIMPVKVLDKNGDGTIASVAEGINYAVAHGAQVINLSLGGTGTELTLYNAVRNAFDNGVIVVVAAGNDDDVVGYPAAYTDYVISVGAIGPNYDTGALERAYYSNYGPELDLVAPGGQLYLDGDSIVGTGIIQNTFEIERYRVKRNIYETYHYGYYSFQGTSMATPHVAGVVAMLLERYPDLTLYHLEDILKKSAHDMGTIGKDDYYGAGLIDAASALLFAASYEPVDTPVEPPVDPPVEPVTTHDINYNLSYSKIAKKLFVDGYVTVQVFVDGSPVANFDVSGHFTDNGKIMFAVSGKTDANGKCVFELSAENVSSRKVVLEMD